MYLYRSRWCRWGRGWSVFKGLEVVDDVVSNQRAATEGSPVHHSDAERRVQVFVLWKLLMAAQQRSYHIERRSPGLMVPADVLILYCSYQLYDINQRGEVWVGLVLLDDGGTQGFTCTLYEDLKKERRGLFFHILQILSSNYKVRNLCTYVEYLRSINRQQLNLLQLPQTPE